MMQWKRRHRGVQDMEAIQEVDRGHHPEGDPESAVAKEGSPFAGQLEGELDDREGELLDLDPAAPQEHR